LLFLLTFIIYSLIYYFNIILSQLKNKLNKNHLQIKYENRVKLEIRYEKDFLKRKSKSIYKMNVLVDQLYEKQINISLEAML